jgi:hypothetical protein
MVNKGIQHVHLNQEAMSILRGFDSWQRSKWVFPSENPATPLDVRNFYNRVWLPALAWDKRIARPIRRAMLNTAGGHARKFWPNLLFFHVCWLRQIPMIGAGVWCAFT